MNELTEEQKAALKRFKERHGRYWKNELRKKWIGIPSHYSYGVDEPLLQQIRNQFGPEWLYRQKEV